MCESVGTLIKLKQFQASLIMCRRNGHEPAFFCSSSSIFAWRAAAANGWVRWRHPLPITGHYSEMADDTSWAEANCRGAMQNNHRAHLNGNLYQTNIITNLVQMSAFTFLLTKQHTRLPHCRLLSFSLHCFLSRDKKIKVFGHISLKSTKSRHCFSRKVNFSRLN